MNYPPARKFLLVACVFSAVAAAIEPYPTNAPEKSKLSVIVRDKYLNLHRHESLKIRCRAKGGHQIDDIPIITFYRKLADDIIMPLSSSSYGVSITAFADKMSRRSLMEQRRHRSKPFNFKHQRGSLRTVKILHLSKQIYEILDYGINMFYCRATTIGGTISEDSFIINKL